MLTTPVSVPDLRPGCAAEPKWDGFRALVSVDAGQVVLRSRRGTEMGSSFPEVVAGAVHLPDATALDGELVVWDAAGRLAFERLQNRLARRGAAAAQAAQEWPAHFVSAPIWALASASISSCTIRSAMARMSSIPSVERSDSRRRIRSDWDRVIVHSSWLNWAFTKESYAMARLLFRERSSPVEVRPGQTPAHSRPLIAYTTTSDTIPPSAAERGPRGADLLRSGLERRWRGPSNRARSWAPCAPASGGARPRGRPFGQGRAGSLAFRPRHRRPGRPESRRRRRHRRSGPYQRRTFP
ncbi:hypothetical protein ABT373_40200 [Streptomyces sp. NPDC000070]|uniref:ATP-dependent DNA ligase n=1 Tax=Streptomyces sp. NPDC000070 TaxID=3154240 RepID=UPI0033165A03